MEIINRKDAIAARLTTYFTGVPCRHGHVAKRYVQSGTCSQCIAEHVGSERDKLRGMTGDRRAALAELVEVKLRAYPSDATLLKETAAALGIARYPVLTASDVVSKAAPIDPAGGTYLYRVRSHIDDVALLRETANALLNAHTVNVQAVRERIEREADNMAEQAAQPLPEWRP